MSHNPANVERFMGFADVYDDHRPKPPPIIVDLLKQLAESPHPSLVVDIGSGTGLSTTIWSPHAQKVIGIEPSADMRRQAEHASRAFSNITYLPATSTATTLPASSADIVTCSQSLHWMDPTPTFHEIARILRPGGVFCAYDCDWPPTIHWEIEQAYQHFMSRAEQLEARHGTAKEVLRQDKSQHLARLRASGLFRYTKEVTLHHTEPGTADRLVGLALSQGMIASLLKHGLTDHDLGIPQFREQLHHLFANRPVTWYFSYRLRIGIK